MIRFEDIINPEYILGETYSVSVEAKDIQLEEWNSLFVVGNNIFQVTDETLFAYKSNRSFLKVRLFKTDTDQDRPNWIL